MIKKIINKNKYKFFIFYFLFFIFYFSFAHGVELSSPSFKIKDPVVGTGSGYGSSSSFKNFSSQHTSFSDISSSLSFTGKYGFLYYPFATPPVLNATGNASSADLIWTDSLAGQGWNVSGYKIGKSSVSGGPYDYTNVGNINNYSYTEQPPGDYCFIVETLDAYGYTIALSNEDCISIYPVIFFDLDTAVSSAETNPPYLIQFGFVSPSDVKTSGVNDNVQMIIVEASTNANNGIVVNVKNSNGNNGLVSASNPSSTINSATATMTPGIENYGLCVITSTLSGFVRSAPYDTGVCAINSNTNEVKALTLAGESILNSSSSPVYNAYAEISLNASVSGVTNAENDYSDNLTFLVTGTF